MRTLAIILVAFALIFIIGASGCNQASSNLNEIIANKSSNHISSGTVNVEIKGFSFNPSEINITNGSTVVWTNLDSVKHTVTFSPNQFYAINLNIEPGKEASQTFEHPGEYIYHCSIHPSMAGKVIVK